MSIKEKFYIREGLVVNGDTIITGSATTTTGFTGSFTGSLTGITSTASFVNPLNQNVTVTGSLVVSGSGATIEVYGDKLIVGTVGGDEGGEILLGKPVTNNSLTGSGVTIDSYRNFIRFFEQGGSARGAYIDLTACAGGVGTNLLSVTNAQTASYVNTLNQDVILSGSLSLSAGTHVILAGGAGTKIGTAANQRLAFFDGTPQSQPDNFIGGAVLTNGAGPAISDDATFDGYTVAQVVAALRQLGLLA